MRWIAHSIKASVLAFWLGVALVSGVAAQQPDGEPTIENYPSLQLPYQERRRLWPLLLNAEDHMQGLALGESVLSVASSLTDKVRTQSMLAHGYMQAGRFDRAEQLIAMSRSDIDSFQFRAMTNGGAVGHQKHFALTAHYRALCHMGTLQFRTEAAQNDCRAVVVSAERARELVGFAQRDPKDADGELIVALTERGRAETVGGRRLEAQRTIAAAIELANKTADRPAPSAYAHRVASGIALASGDYLVADAMARRSIAIWDERGVSATHFSRLSGHLPLQAVLVMSGRWAEANRDFDLVDTEVQGNPQAERRARNLMARSLAYAHSNRLATLIPLLMAQTQDLQERLGANHPQAALSEGLLGAARAESRDLAQRQQAMPTLKAAVRILMLEQARTDFSEGVSFDPAVARFILERYLELTASVSSVPGSEEGALAFQIADSLRSSSVQGAVQDAAARSAAGTGALGDLVRREQDLGNEARSLREFIVRQSAESAERRVDTVVEQMRKRLEAITTLRAGLRADIAKGFPQYAELVRPQAPTPQAVARRLAEGEVFVSLLPTEVGIHAWAVSRQGGSYRFSPGATQRVADLVAVLRRSTELDQNTGRAPRFAAQAAHALYQELFGPLQDQLVQARHLVVAGGGDLGRLPYAALLQKPWEGDDAAQAEWLVKGVAVSQVPSASAWLSVQRLSDATRAQETLAAWGDPRFNVQAGGGVSVVGAVRAVAWTRASKGFDLTPGRAAEEFGYGRIPALPETRDELHAIAQALGADATKDVRLGAQATRASVIAASRSGELGRKRVVAFATHGLMAGDLPNLNQPALALAATGNEDKEPLAPLLTLEDVLTLKLNADWVVLSACNTAAGDGMGDEALSGLARGFLYAGSRSLLVTQWAVETESAKLLTTGAFEHYIANPQASKAESLRQSMLRVMQRPEYGHPAYWAPFVLIGDGAR